MVSFFLEVEPSDNGHQNGLSLSTFVGMVAVGVFPGDDGRPDHSFYMIIIGSHFGMFQKRKEFVLMTF
jgi:hypothetical protein